MDTRVLICYVPSYTDQLAERAAEKFREIVGNIPARDFNSTQTSTSLALHDALSAWKLSAAFLRDTTTLVVIGHGSVVYKAIDQSFVRFVKDFKALQSLVFISCELDKNHFAIPGFEANVINLLGKSLGSHSKVYASKTDVHYSVIDSQNFVWFHTPESHVIPAKSSSMQLKDAKSKEVEDSMDIFYY